MQKNIKEHFMENFKKKLKKEIFIAFIISIIISISSATLIVLDILRIFRPIGSLGVVVGGLGAGIALMVRTIIYSQTIKNENALKELYIRETDERNVFIEKTASKVSTVLIPIALFTAAVISAYINPIVCNTLFVVLMCHVLITQLSLLVCRKKY